MRGRDSTATARPPDDPRCAVVGDTDEVRETAGRGANEVLAWVAAFGAFSTGGQFTMEQEFYEAIPGWIAGMAMMAARQANGVLSHVRGAADAGQAVILITHNYAQALSVADDIVILAHGAVAGTFRRGEVTAEDVMTLVSR